MKYDDWTNAFRDVLEEPEKRLVPLLGFEEELARDRERKLTVLQTLPALAQIEELTARIMKVRARFRGERP